MDPKRFKEFKRQSLILIESSNWLTDKISKIVDEAEVVDTYEELSDLDLQLNSLSARARWEDEQFKQFQHEYRDIINDGYE